MERVAGRVDGFLAALLVVAAQLALFAQIHDYTLLGWDTYPQIASARIGGVDDLVGSFTEETADGVYPYSFYRPVFNLSLAADHALWGIEPFGYHVTDVVLGGLCALSLFWLMGRLLPGRRLGAWTALVAFLLLPVHIEILPLVSRRMEMLCALGVALALGTQVRRAEHGRIRDGVLPACFTLFAVGAKEAGVIAPALAFALVLLYDRGALGPRLRAACAVSAPHWVAVGTVFAFRFTAIGGLGGHPTTDPLGAITRLPWALGLLLAKLSALRTAEALPPETWTGYAILGLGAFCVAAVGCLVFVARHVGREAPRAPATIVLALGWIGLLAGVYGAAGLVQPWHLLLPGQALAVLAGAAAVQLSSSFETRHRTVAAAGLVALLGWLLLEARYSPLLRSYHHWERASSEQRVYLRELSRRIEASPDGSVLETSLPPVVLASDPNPAGGRRTTPMHVYSLPSWAALRFPDRRIEFRHPDHGNESDAPRTTKLLVTFRPGRYGD